jgi:hypothetical protein
MPLQLSWISQPHRTQITRSDTKRKLNPVLKISAVGDNISQEYENYEVECLLCTHKEDNKSVLVPDGLNISRKLAFVIELCRENSNISLQQWCGNLFRNVVQ